jgi:hypothetical protein
MTNKKEILASITTIAKKLGRAPSLQEFTSFSEISEYYVLQSFRSWNDAVRAARLRPYTLNIPADRHVLLEDWGRVVRRLRALPTRRVYADKGQFNPGTLDKHLGPWRRLPEAFRNFAKAKPEWADVLALLPVPAPPGPAPRNRQQLPHHNSTPRLRSRKTWPTELRDRPTCGDPTPCPWMCHEPLNEQGVVLLFGMLAKDLGFMIETVQKGFPDCEAKRQIGPDRWQRVRIEFEFESRNFLTHGHPTRGCDLLVCWRHNWPHHPRHLEILELSRLFQSLPGSNN